jgi:tol-pal system protein YbgF
MMYTKSIPYLFGFALAAAALPARAGLFDDDEARRRIDQLRTQVEAMQRTIDTRFGRVEADVQDRRAVVDLAGQIDALRNEVARMRGSIEVVTNQLEQQEKRSRDLYVDVDNRLRKIEQARLDDQRSRDDKAAQEKASQDRIAQDAANETKLYESALNQFKLGNYQAAIREFQGFIGQYPQSQLTPSAQYWIGNGHYALREYRAAVSAQERVITTWPDNAKAPDAMLNIASSQAELGDNNSARQTLRALIDKYPKSPAADQARQRLARR